MRRHRAERRIADVGEKVVVRDVSGADQLDAGLVEAALDEFLHEDRAEPRRHEDEHGVWRVVLHPLQERSEVRILQRHANLLRHRSAALRERVGEPFLGVDPGTVVGDDGDHFLDPVLQRPVGHGRGRLRQRERGAQDIRRLLGDHRSRSGGDDLGNLRLGRDGRCGEREGGQAEAHEHARVIVADQLFGESLGHVGCAGVILDHEVNLLASDGVAVLRQEELGAGALLLAGRGRGPGHRHDHADGHGIVVG